MYRLDLYDGVGDLFIQGIIWGIIELNSQSHQEKQMLLNRGINIIYCFYTKYRDHPRQTKVHGKWIYCTLLNP